MIPVDQTKFVASPDADPSEMGNCMQAAVASLLELPLDEVPHFAAATGGEDAWWVSLLDFLDSRGFWLARMIEPKADALGLCAGKSPRGDWEHLVVYRGDALAHDPHPSRDGVTEATEFWYLVPYEPKLSTTSPGGAPQAPAADAVESRGADAPTSPGASAEQTATKETP